MKQYNTVFVLLNQRWNLTVNQQKLGWRVSNQAQNFNAGFVKPRLYNIFSFILFKVLIEGRRQKNLTQKRNSNLVLFLRDCLGKGSRECFASFCVRFGGGNKNFIQSKREKRKIIHLFSWEHVPLTQERRSLTFSHAIYVQINRKERR